MASNMHMHGLDPVSKKPSAKDFLNRPASDVIKEDMAKYHNADEGLSFTVFGASGDLAKKKIFPSLFHLFKKGFLPSHTLIVGYARSEFTNEMFHEHLRPYFQSSDQNDYRLNEFFSLVVYHRGRYDNGADFGRLDAVLRQWEDQFIAGSNRILYLALPPSVFYVVTQNIHDHCMNDPKRGYSRVIVEKPFGKDSASSEKLSNHLSNLFEEHQIYRIDHYLGKEMVQNIQVMRFSNAILRPTWNRDNVQCVRITFKENFGTRGRGGYFDQFGIIRDIMQNHLMQVLSIVTMEKPVSMSPTDLRNEKVRVLRSIPPVELASTVIGQYVASDLPGNEDSTKGYTDDPGVPDDSITPTYCTAVLFINNERWQGVPFIIKAGKALEERRADVRVQFKDPPGDIFVGTPVYRNELVVRLQPDEAVYLKFNIKTPGLEIRPLQAELDMTYKSRFEEDLPDAYERLLLDIMRGNQSSFVRTDELAEAWRIWSPLLNQLEQENIKPEPYPFGSRGPASGDKLAAKHGFAYHRGAYLWHEPHEPRTETDKK